MNQMRKLRREIAKGLRDLDRGRSFLFDRELAESVKAVGRRKLRKSGYRRGPGTATR